MDRENSPRVGIKQCLSILEKGKACAIPTETVYGLAARIDKEEAIESIFALKNRPRQNPLIVHVSSIEQMAEYVDIDFAPYKAFIKEFWPGPLSILFPLKKELSNLITAGLDTVVIRSPYHKLCRELLCQSGPLVAPSANPSGRPSPVSARDVIRDYGSRVPVLDGGACERGVESTIIGFDKGEFVILREGALSAEELQKSSGYPVRIKNKNSGKSSRLICPGSYFRHYAPVATLKRYKGILKKKVAVIGFDEIFYGDGVVIYSLGKKNEPAKALQKLYRNLRQIDIDGWKEVYVDLDFPISGLGSTLKERLSKAMSEEDTYNETIN